ncbi:MAG: putative LPS assembly protein LptD [Candidatus Palauibacterales bacterium]|nr:putative LPS assembly protein LptD [Candidatus Palauibacterales bacterium]
MRSMRLVLAAIVLLIAASVATAQEPTRRPGAVSGQEDRIRQAAPRQGDQGLPDDTLGLAADTTPRIDIEQRRQGLEAEGFPARDEVFRQLKNLPGFMVFEYRGEEVRLDVAEERIGLLGDAQVNRGPDVLTADTIRYRGNVKFMSAAGNIELVGADQKDVKSDSVLYYDLASLKGTVFGAETQFMQGATTWRVVGDVIPKAQDTVYASNGAFTSCDVELPHYRFQAGQIKLVNQDVIVAWPVVLYVSKVPVFWLPFFAQDIRPGRRSGILPPRFGFNDVVQTSGSTSRNVTDFGYYWAINDYTDVQGSVDWFSGNYTRLNGAFRYRFLKRFIRGSVAYGETFSESGRNLTLGLNHDQELGLATTLRVSARYIQNTQTFQDQTYDPRLQTQSIDSDAGLNHRFSFANVSVSARRRQFLTSEKTELTLPQFSLSFSPVTLFSAPRSSEGLFNNMTLSGSGTFGRQSTSQPFVTDRANTSGSVSSGLRVKQLNLSVGARYNEASTTEEDSTGVEQPTTKVRQMDWNAGLDYQVNLVGSTTFRPNIRWNGGYFRSPDTAGDFVSVPTQMSFGATLSTDVFGFYPGFGAFSRIRHKFSPGFSWAYAPAVSVDSARGAIPGFPLDSIRARHTLSFTLRQTFEAKVRSAEQGTQAPASAGLREAPGGPGFPGDTVGLQPDTVGAESDTLTRADLTGPPRMPPRARVVTLLALNTSALVFDFERSKLGEPVLISPTVSNNISSDLLRGLTINMTHRLFEGTGADRRFSPSLQQIALSFSLRSGTSLGDLVGLGTDAPVSPRDRMAAAPAEREPDARSGLREFYDADQTDPFSDGARGGPWNLTLRYSLIRPQTEGGFESQTVDGTLSFHPTPGWAARWSTQYNFTSGDFGQQLITLDRDLHRWRASFQFARSPNGNVIFSVGVHLTDAPELKGDYKQQTN